MIRAGIIGATGYAGAELVRILAGHPDVELTAITSRQYAGNAFGKVFPAMAGVVDLVCEQLDMDDLCSRTDVVFLALPHKIPMSLVPEIIRQGKRVIDLSADFRFSDIGLYEQHYQPHTAPEVNTKAVYGLCEIYREKIRKARIIGNPGCYPTSILLPLIPLLKEGLIDPKTIISDSKSGVSGAGRSVSLTTHFCEVNNSFRAYKIAVHRHNPEINEVLSREAGSAVSITFVPHLVPMTRGMLTTTYASLAIDATEADIRNCIADYYATRPFVRIRPDEDPPNTAHVRGTNFCDIGVRIDGQNKRLILVSAIDNLVKGAAGQAVQNMNIMYDLDEVTGLNTVPWPV